MKRSLRTQAFLALLMFSCASTGAAKSEQPMPDIPVVKSADLPLYPHLARLARIEGTVQIEATTDGTNIVRMSARGAHKLLMDAAQENLKTWRFYPHKAQAFTITFVYKIEPPEVYGPINPTIILNLPNRVEIRTKMHPVETVTTDRPR
jgi:outer membrane biosynthesis protein TonB